MIRKKFIAESRDRASLYANTCTIGTSRPRPFSDELMLFATCHVVTYKMFVNLVTTRGKSAWAGTRRYGVPADAISVPADRPSASEIVKFTISIPRESCTNAKAK